MRGGQRSACAAVPDRRAAVCLGARMRRRYLVNLVHEVPLPPPGRFEIQVAIDDVCLHLSRPALNTAGHIPTVGYHVYMGPGWDGGLHWRSSQSPRPLTALLRAERPPGGGGGATAMQVAFSYLFRLMEPGNLVRVVEGLLLEAKVVLLSRHVQLLGPGSVLAP